MKRFLTVLFVLAGFISVAQKSKTDKLVKINTPYGEMIAVFYDQTPLHKANFIRLAEEGKYDSTIFHRVIENFMIQGGDIYRSGKFTRPSEDTRIPAEFVDGLIHRKGEIAAARTNNPEKKSSDCQFYIVQGKVLSQDELTIDQNKLNRVFAELMQAGKIDTLRNVLIEMQKEGKFEEMNDFITQSCSYLEEVSGESLRKDEGLSEEQLSAYSTVGGVPHLDGAYTVYGRIISGLEVIDKIAAIETNQSDLPLETVYMTMEVLELKKKKITKIYGYSYD